MEFGACYLLFTKSCVPSIGCYMTVWRVGVFRGWRNSRGVFGPQINRTRPFTMFLWR